MKDVIKKEQLFNHSIDAIWNAITKAEEISTWFIKGCLTITGEVKKSNPYTLIYTWIVENTTAETTVSWKLEPVENGTKLYLEHSGISNYAGETAIAMFDSFNGGWDNCINELSNYLKELVNAG